MANMELLIKDRSNYVAWKDQVDNFEGPSIGDVIHRVATRSSECLNGGYHWKWRGYFARTADRENISTGARKPVNQFS